MLSPPEPFDPVTDTKQWRRSLHLWFWFMRESVRREPGATWWKHALSLRPDPDETFAAWLDRMGGDVWPFRGWAIAWHSDLRTVPMYRERGERILVLAVNDQDYSKEELTQAFEKLLKRLPSRQKTDRFRQRALAQPNASLTKQKLRDLIWCARALRLKNRGFAPRKIRERIWPNHAIASGEQRMQRALRRAEMLLVAVRDGKFPDPKRQAFGE